MYININNFTDEFGNLLKEFEIIKYEKYADGKWYEIERFESGRTYFEIDGKLHRKLDNRSFTLNMDFNSENCGVCYKIGELITGKKKITGNYDLFTVSYPKDTLTLKKQTYSNNTSFYYLADERGNFKVNYGSSDIKDLLEQLEHENKVYSQSFKAYNEQITKQVIETNNTLITFITTNILNAA